MTPSRPEIILASASYSRRKLLEAAGVDFRVMAAGVDEAAIKRRHDARKSGFDELAADLASQKALAVAERHTDALVIGADQILVLNGEAFDKPDSIETARQQLLRLRGETHSLETAVACAMGKDVLWLHVEAPRLTMWAFSASQLESYFVGEGEAVTETVGGYKIEGPAIQLFESIAGDYFSILGLPLLPLLGFLRTRGAIAA
ncbi:MAG TPA: nucleoside triphosphate pyrophosphatase [Aestuariivirgaceae bacterium]|nr:nucleoside triphosphate pyrophosphatase [Aestuariivirgaceae bacterium]